MSISEKEKIERLIIEKINREEKFIILLTLCVIFWKILENNEEIWNIK